MREEQRRRREAALALQAAVRGWLARRWRRGQQLTSSGSFASRRRSLDFLGSGGGDGDNIVMKVILNLKPLGGVSATAVKGYIVAVPLAGVQSLTTIYGTKQG